jgi:hypothetical protein
MYSSSGVYYGDEIKECQLDGACSKHGKNDKYRKYFCSIRKPEGKTQLLGLTLKREDSIKLDLKELGCMWIIFIWLRTGHSGQTLVNAPYDTSHEGNFGCRKRRKVS